VICATNKNLEQAVKDGTFREDLFYRVDVFPICIPPLRSRKGDLAKLAHYFLDTYSRAMNKKMEGFTRDAMLALKAYDWPGNVRELENAIERAVVVSKGPMIEKEHLPLQALTASEPLGRRLEDIEHKYIKEVLRETSWNISRSANILDIDRVTLYHKIQKYGLKRNQ
jgi:transcriptional regulator with PAS, ATPase and Fis domain